MEKKSAFNALFWTLLLLLAVFTGCQSSSTTANEGQDSVEIKHKLGLTKVPSQPTRIVVLDIGALETLHELGVTPTGVPKKFMPDYLADVKADPKVSDVGSVIEPDFEAISALAPQLILISTRQERFYQELSEIAPTVFIGTDTKNYIPSFIENAQLLAKIVDKESLIQQKLDSLQLQIAAAQNKFKTDPKKALFLIYNNGRFSAFGKGSRFGFIHDVLHIKPVMELKDESVHGQRISNELIAEANPDYLFIVDRNAAVLSKKADRSEIENTLVKQTAAYKNQQIFYLNPDVWFISGGGLTSVKMMINDIVQLFN
ncbi:siderophore ABC transporter substrate-binding protein [Sphingobacterium sp. LRF_L2]|uniref:siderophore ABC transporter substrate-binding protein n=1 Tax=Sphingobacterium sp. LRF_L2 TaxID=3369421 RepID=UPI003F60C921